MQNLAVTSSCIKNNDDILNRCKELSRAPDFQVRKDAIKFIIQTHETVSDYRALMLNALTDERPLVRHLALSAYDTYSKPGEFEPLEHFERDNYNGEVGMGSYHIYHNRNLALETIERSIGITFKKVEKTEVIENHIAVFWWDWTPFHEWKDRKKS